MSWFISSLGDSVGRKTATTCIRLRQDAGGQPGAEIGSPRCVTFEGQRLGPQLFQAALGSTNSFQRLNLPVAASTWVGVDLTMKIERDAPGAFMDVAAFLWLDDTNRDIGR